MIDPATYTRQVSIPIESASLPGVLSVPTRALGMVIFAHDSASSRHSPRNQFVATSLHDSRLGTLLFDLLTEPEARDRRYVFDIERLSDRLLRAARWVMSAPDTSSLPVAPTDRLDQLRTLCDRVVCLHTCDDFHAVGQFYRNFDQVSDDRVADLLHAFAPRPTPVITP